MKKTIEDRIERTCVVCGGTIRVIIYADAHYRGGHYFGKIPLYRKKELEKMRKSGTYASTVIPGAQIYNYDPKPYAYAEYWECPPCYWHRRSRAPELRKEEPALADIVRRITPKNRQKLTDWGDSVGKEI